MQKIETNASPLLSMEAILIFVSSNNIRFSLYTNVFPQK